MSLQLLTQRGASNHHIESISSAASSAAVSWFNLTEAVRSSPAAAMAAVSTYSKQDRSHTYRQLVGCTNH